MVLSSAPRVAELRVHQSFAIGVDQATDIGNAVLELVRSHGGARMLVAIDGAGGSGKTSLAAAVAGYLGDCAVVHGDDFYRPMSDREREQLDAEQGYHRYFDWQRLRAQVLEPLRAGQPARYEIYDWAAGQLGDWQEIPPSDVVIVEGVYSMRPELFPYYDLTIYVDTPRETCLQRLQERGQDSRKWISRWRAAEDYYIDTTQPQNRAALVVKNG